MAIFVVDFVFVRWAQTALIWAATISDEMPAATSAGFVSGQEALYRLCYRMRKEGQKRFTVRRSTETNWP